MIEGLRAELADAKALRDAAVESRDNWKALYAEALKDAEARVLVHVLKAFKDLREVHEPVGERCGATTLHDEPGRSRPGPCARPKPCSVHGGGRS